MRDGEVGGEAQEWMFRLHYREQFKLTSQEMDDEPAKEVAIYNTIWKLRQAREKLEDKRGQQQKT